MPQLDVSQFSSQLFWLAVSFTVLYIVCSRHVLPRLSDLMLERQTRETNDIEDADNLNTEAERNEAEAVRITQEAQQQAQQHIQTALHTARQTTQAQLDETLEKALAQTRAQESALLADAQAADAQVSKAADALAKALTENLLRGAQPSKTRQEGS